MCSLFYKVIKDTRKKYITNPNRPLAHKIVSKLMKESAEICAYSNAERCTLRGHQSAGVTRIVDCDGAVSESEKLAASRHKNMSTHALYQ